MTAYTQQLDQKIQYLQQLFQGLDFPEIQVFESPEQHYRMRAEFRIWHEGGEMFYAMFERGQKASGASLKDKAQAMEMLADLDKLVGENK